LERIMAKSTTRTSRGKKKLQDVIESIPDDAAGAVTEAPDDAGNVLPVSVLAVHDDDAAPCRCR
jgi:hypothetical protein